MKIASDATLAVPRDYDEMEKLYGKFIADILLRVNKVGRNGRDLYNHIWEKLLGADVLGKYVAMTEQALPKTMTALEACDMLGVTFTRWRTAMWAYHKGDPVFDKTTGKEVSRRHGHWMPTPINLAEFEAKGQKGYSAKSALFDTLDIGKLASDERTLKNGSVRGPFRLHGEIRMPEAKATKQHFQSYLAVAVKNHFANFCRTQQRKHKERAPDALPGHRPPVDDSISWEATLEDPKERHQETIAALHEAKQRLSTSLHDGMRNIPSCKPVEEHEMQMFELLEDGFTLGETVRKMDIPKSVQQLVLRSVQSHARAAG